MIMASLCFRTVKWHGRLSVFVHFSAQSGTQSGTLKGSKQVKSGHKMARTGYLQAKEKTLESLKFQRFQVVRPAGLEPAIFAFGGQR